MKMKLADTIRARKAGKEKAVKTKYKKIQTDKSEREIPIPPKGMNEFDKFKWGNSGETQKTYQGNSGEYSVGQEHKGDYVADSSILYPRNRGKNYAKPKKKKK